MHAYNRLEADQTSSIAVCASHEEWREILSSIKEVDPWLNLDSLAWRLERALKDVGLD